MRNLLQALLSTRRSQIPDYISIPPGTCVHPIAKLIIQFGWFFVCLFVFISPHLQPFPFMLWSTFRELRTAFYSNDVLFANGLKNKRETSFRQKCGLLVSQTVATTFNRLKKSQKFWDWEAKFCPGGFKHIIFKGAICAVDIQISWHN